MIKMERAWVNSLRRMGATVSAAVLAGQCGVSRPGILAAAVLANMLVSGDR